MSTESSPKIISLEFDGATIRTGTLQGIQASDEFPEMLPKTSTGRTNKREQKFEN